MLIPKVLRGAGYNVAEQAIIYGCNLVGAVAPTLVTRYAIAGPIINPECWKEHLLAWGVSLAVNAIPVPSGGYVEHVQDGRVSRTKRKWLPLVGLSTMAGIFAGDKLANRLRIHRRERRELSDSL